MNSNNTRDAVCLVGMLIPWNQLQTINQYKTFQELWINKSKFLTARLQQIATNFQIFRRSATDANIDRIEFYQKKNQEISIEDSELEIEGILDENYMDNDLELLENIDLDKRENISNSSLEIPEFFQQACTELRKLWQINYSLIKPISDRLEFYWNDIYADDRNHIFREVSICSR